MNKEEIMKIIEERKEEFSKYFTIKVFNNYDVILFDNCEEHIKYNDDVTDGDLKELIYDNLYDLIFNM